jgi:hypothetical protein
MRALSPAHESQQFGPNMRHAYRIVLVIIVAGLLAGCALMRPTGSWVELSHQVDAEPLSEAIVAFAAEALSEPGTLSRWRRFRKSRPPTL